MTRVKLIIGQIVDHCLQSIALATLYFLLNFLLLVAPLIVLYLVWYQYYITILLYCAWYIYSQHGNLSSLNHITIYARRSGLYNYSSRYFPLTLIKTTEIDAKKNYIFACHPHGCYPMVTVVNLSAYCKNGFNQLFSGLRVLIAGHRQFFAMPFMREVITIMGGTPVDKANLMKILTNQVGGQALVIFPGGAREGMYTQPKTMDLVLKSRKGFIKVALESGASIVPVISFGENDVFTIKVYPEGNWIRRLQQYCHKHVGIPFPLIVRGRGLLQPYFGLFPYRLPCTTVVGEPIEVDCNNNIPFEQQVETLHKLYIERLTKLYHDNRDKYGYGEVALNLVE